MSNPHLTAADRVCGLLGVGAALGVLFAEVIRYVS